MPDEPIIDAEVVEEAGAELVPATPAGILFRTDNPAAIIAEAQERADALMAVVKQRKLFKTISGKDYLFVEAWTLLGSMSGVFAVVAWTKQVDINGGGWEARAEAKTMSGAVVGAAEALCLRSESRWHNADEYAVKSMAQTRAVSKCLRAPLGFMAQLAGFEATPAEEMPSGTAPEPSRSEVRREGPPSYPVSKSWPKIKDAYRDCDNPDESEALYEAFLRAATYHLYGQTSLKDITSEERKVMAQKAAGAVCWMHDTDAGRDGPFSFFLEAQHRAAWATVLDGTALEIPDYVPPEPPLPPEVEEEAARIAAEVFGEEA